MSDFKRKILVVDDEAGMRHMLRLVLEKEGYEVVDAADAETGLEVLVREEADVALCDIRMPGMDGLGFLREISQMPINPTLIMMSAYGSVDMALECMKQGAYDYISKPFKPDEVILTVRKAEERLRLLRENSLMMNQLRTRKSHRNIAYKSELMENVMSLVVQVADVRSPVLVTGETGTGKELIARALHDEGSRSEAPFLAVNCSAIAPNLIESELFGHAKGSFTGADRHHRGLFEEADGGTLFLDEIGELPLDLQPKLLRVLQEGEVRRVGESKSRKVDVRVLAATARDLQEATESGIFRDDLFYRLAVVEIRIPALRERREDIPLLAEHFLKIISERDHRNLPTLTEDAVASLLEYDWPGNVRELENFMEKTVIFCRDEKIDAAHMPWEFRRRSRESTDGLSLKDANERLEKEYIRKALASTDGNRTQAAKILEISLRALQYKIKEYDLK